jgi:23S rRNA pseudouridine2605 synthase
MICSRLGLNKYLSLSLNISRRAADDLIAAKKVKLNGQVAILGSRVEPEQDTVQYLGKKLQITERELTYILLNKPAGYLSSKVSQGGAPTLYELLPKKYQKLNLNIAGRLDKDSCGLILLTNDGDYLNQLIHPKFNKTKTYLVKLSKEISEADLIKLKAGIQIGDSRPSKFQQIEPIPHSGGQPNEVSAGGAGTGTAEKRGSSSLPWEGTSPQAMAGGVYQIQLTEGRNRQIRRTFYELGYKVKYLQRTQLGLFKLGSLKEGEHEEVKKD